MFFNYVFFVSIKKFYSNSNFACVPSSNKFSSFFFVNIFIYLEDLIRFGEYKRNGVVQRMALDFIFM